MAKIVLGELCDVYFYQGADLGWITSGARYYVGGGASVQRLKPKRPSDIRVRMFAELIVPRKYSNIGWRPGESGYFKPEYKHLTIEDFRPDNIIDVVPPRTEEYREIWAYLDELFPGKYQPNEI